MAFSTRSRARTSGITLTERDASLAKGMLARGDRQNDIAAWFGVNPGRIAEISTGASFQQVPVSKDQGLPPPGPYVVRDLVRKLWETTAKLSAVTGSG